MLYLIIILPLFSFFTFFIFSFTSFLLLTNAIQLDEVSHEGTGDFLRVEVQSTLTEESARQARRHTAGKSLLASPCTSLPSSLPSPLPSPLSPT